MTKQDILDAMEKNGLDRQWLSANTEYDYYYIRNSLTPKAKEPSSKFANACKRAFLEEERRSEVGETAPTNNIWDAVFFSGSETIRIHDAKTAGGYSELKDLYRDAVISFTDELLAGKPAGLPMVAEDEGQYNKVSPLHPAQEANAKEGEQGGSSAS